MQRCDRRSGKEIGSGLSRSTVKLLVMRRRWAHSNAKLFARCSYDVSRLWRGCLGQPFQEARRRDEAEWPRLRLQGQGALWVDPVASEGQGAGPQDAGGPWDARPARYAHRSATQVDLAHA